MGSRRTVARRAAGNCAGEVSEADLFFLRICVMSGLRCAGVVPMMWSWRKEGMGETCAVYEFPRRC